MLTRRRFLAAGAGAAAAVAVPAKVLAASKTTDIYKLEAGNPPVCSACVNHDTSSLFPSRKAANGNRAHVGCNCPIKKGTIDASTFTALFGRPEHLRAYRVDRRWPWVRAILKHNPPSF